MGKDKIALETGFVGGSVLSGFCLFFGVHSAIQGLLLVCCLLQKEPCFQLQVCMNVRVVCLAHACVLFRWGVA